VLYGEVHAMPDSYSVTLRLLEVASGKELARTAGSYNRDVEEMVWATRAQVARLKAPERFAGRLVVESPAAAKVTVNGTAVRPGEQLNLKPGLHEVGVQSAGKALQSWVDVRFEHVATARLSGDASKLAVTYAPWATPDRVEFAAVPAPRDGVPAVALATEAEPASQGYPKWPGFVALGLGVALAAGGVVELVQARSLRDELQALRVDGVYPASTFAQAREKQDAMNQAQTVGVSLAGVGAAALLGGSLYLFFAPGPQGGQVAVAGRF